MIQKCTHCQQFQKQPNMKILNCQKHYLCNTCYPKSQPLYCDQCQIVISQLSQQGQQLRNYPIQGIMVHHHKLYNPEGENQFSSVRNCYQRTTGWMLCNLLAVIFFFSGLAVAIKTSQTGTGVILTIVGIVGILATIYFLCKVRKVDRYYESTDHLNQGNFIYIKRENNDRNQRRTISSAVTQLRRY